jgi:hypothetical protein
MVIILSQKELDTKYFFKFVTSRHIGYHVMMKLKVPVFFITNGFDKEKL